MTETTMIVFIVSVLIAVIALIFILRKQDISKFNINTGKVKAGVETRENGAVTLKGVKQKGEKNKLNIKRGSVHVEDFEQNGKKQITKITPENNSESNHD